MTSRVRFFVVLLLGLCSIGADECASTPALPVDPNYYCLTDPPVGCAAYCSAPDVVTFTPACSHISAGDREIAFEILVMAQVQDIEAQGVRACPQANALDVLTPCMMGLPPIEWPNQSECTSPPEGCPVGAP